MLTAVARAGDPPVYKIAEAPAPKVGSKVEVTTKEVTKTETVRTFVGAEQADRVALTVTVTSRYTLEVLKVEDGEPSAYRVRFQLLSWDDGSTDTPSELSDDIDEYRFDRVNGVFEWTGIEKLKNEFVSPTSPAPPLKPFLDRLARELASPPIEGLLEPEIVAKGSTWTLEPHALKPLLLRDTRLGTGSKIEASLESLDTKTVRLKVTAALPLAALPGTDARTKGAAWKTTVKAEWPVSGRPRDGSFDVRHTFSGKGRARRPDGRPYVLEMTITARRTQRVEQIP